MLHFRRISPLALALAAFALGLPAGVVAADAPPAPAAAKDSAPRYPLHGVVLGVFPEKTTLLIKNEKITGLLDAGTMAFRVSNPDVFKYAKKGQAISATVIVREDDFWLTDIQLSKR
ncbi:MAG TPA: copper-binding protein [Opitutus sp.]|nr:copper-binding protein [Opitutus sp.]